MPEDVVTKGNAELFSIKIQLKESSKELVHIDVVNTYQKGNFYCVMYRRPDGVYKVYKYPIANIWRVVEEV